MMAMGIKAYFHEERMSDDGAGGEAYHEDMRKQSRLILLFLQTLVVIGEMVDADFCFVIRMGEDGVGVEAYFLDEMTT